MTIRVINVYSYSAVENRIYEGKSHKHIQNGRLDTVWDWELMLD